MSQRKLEDEPEESESSMSRKGFDLIRAKARREVEEEEEDGSRRRYDANTFEGKSTEEDKTKDHQDDGNFIADNHKESGDEEEPKHPVGPNDIKLDMKVKKVQDVLSDFKKAIIKDKREKLRSIVSKRFDSDNWRME